jgi:hypothetical protein
MELSWIYRDESSSCEIDRLTRHEPPFLFLSERWILEECNVSENTQKLLEPFSFVVGCRGSKEIFQGFVYDFVL